MPSTDAWCTFNEQRRATALIGAVLGRLPAASYNLTIEVARTSLPGGTLALPAHYDDRQVAQVLLDGEPMQLTQRSVGGESHVFAVADFSAGSHQVAFHFQ